MVNIQALEQALLPIQNLGQRESTFEVDGTVVAMRICLPHEEVAAQAYANEMVDFAQETTERHRVSEYVDRFKLAILSYSIVQVGALDLRDVKSILTGETTDSGVPVKKQKHIVLRDLLGKWTRPVTTAAFGKYTEMLEEVESSASRAVKFAPSDLDTEIERLEKRLAEFKAEKEKREQDSDPIRQQLFTLAQQQAEAEREQMQNPSPPPRPPQPPQEPAPEPEAQAQPEPQEPVERPQGQRQSAIPTQAAPPVRRPPPQQAPQPQVQQQAPQPVQSSVVDVEEEALLDEGERIAHARAQWKQEREESARVSREPPHRQAANTTNAVVDTGANQLAAARPAGNVDGKEAFRLPPTELTQRGRGKETPPDRSAPTQVNKPPTSPSNPRFNPPKR